MPSTKQLKMIWVLARQIGLDDEGLHEMIEGLTGKKSLKELTKTDIKTVVNKLKLCGAKSAKKRQPTRELPGNVVEMITSKQKKLIQIFESTLLWQEDPNRLKGFCKRIIKKDMATTKAEGTKLILALKQMVHEKLKNKPVEGCR